jgi:hypothetical protein
MFNQFLYCGILQMKILNKQKGKMKFILTLIIASATGIYFFGCSASTGSRYEKNEVKEVVNHDQKDEDYTQTEEYFDITPYKTEIKLETEELQAGTLPPDIWYEYGEDSNDSQKSVVGTTDGYRVQVVATDDIEEANQIRSEIYTKTTNKQVYVNFEPPFYKVKVGDFTSRQDANDLKFMLNQLGYKEARIVQETINLFEFRQ